MRVSRAITVLAAAALLVVAAPAAQAQDGEFEKTLTVSGPVTLDVETRSGSIEVRRGGSGSVHIRGEIRRSRNWFGSKGSEADVQAVIDNPPIEQDGNTIRIVKLDRDYRLSVSYEITVPAETTVEAGTGSGSIKVSGVQGPVTSATGSGSVSVEDVARGATIRTGSGSVKAENVAGEFSAETGSGSIKATLMESGRVVLSTGSGSISASGIEGSLSAETGSGSVRLEGAPKGDWDVSTGSGGIRVAFPESASFDLEARAGSGSVTTDFPITIRGRVSRRKLEGKVGGGGPQVTLSTGSGSIRIGSGGGGSI